jgi:hypothetical protein
MIDNKKYYDIARGLKNRGASMVEAIQGLILVGYPYYKAMDIVISVWSEK